MERAWVAKVAVSAATYSFDKPYDYIVPAALLPMAQVGVRVMVPFGGGNKMTEALILSLAEEEKRPKLKTVASVLDADPVLDQADLRLAYWMRERYFCTIYDAVKTILPAGLWYRVRETYHVAGDVSEAEIQVKLKGQEKLAAVYEAVIAAGGQADLETLKERCGDEVTGQLKKLVSMGLLSSETSAQRKISDKMVKRVSLALPPEEAIAAVEGKKKRSPLRYEVVLLLCTVGSALSSDI